MSDHLGILPGPVHRDERAEVALVFLTLTADLDETTVQQWLRDLKGTLDALEEVDRHGDAYASLVLGLGANFFQRFPTHAANVPHGFAKPTPSMPATASMLSADVLLHITYTSEAHLADLLRRLWDTRPVLANIEIEHGFARKDDREAFGQLDGLRNLTSAQRRASVFIDNDDDIPEEAPWMARGSYGAYAKIEQNLDAWKVLDSTTREQIIGRRQDDGSRLDQPANTDPHAEGPFSDAATPPPSSHVRKTGPRDAIHDQLVIFRRGVPYLEAEGGALHAGLHFVSYQASLDDFDVMLNHWMLNPDFPTPGAGQDLLLAHGLITFLRAGYFAIVPEDQRFPGAGFFDPTPEEGNHRVARIHIRKSVTDQNGSPARAELGDIEFQLFDPSTGTPLSEPGRTNPAGRLMLAGAKIGQPVLLRETPDARFDPQADVTVEVTKRNQVVTVVNRLRANANPYGG